MSGSNSNTGNLLEAMRQAKVDEVVQQTLRAPGRGVAIPPEVSDRLNAVLTNAVFPEMLAVRARERSISDEALRMTLR